SRAWRWRTWETEEKRRATVPIAPYQVNRYYASWYWKHPSPACGKAKNSHHLFGDHHVVDVVIRRQAPAVGEGAVDHAGLLGDGEPVVEQIFRQFVGGDELVPLMGAARQPTQHIFSADDGERKTLPVAIEGGDHHQPARLEHCRAAADEGADVGDVLDHLHR